MDDSEELLKETVFRLLNHKQTLEGTLREVSSLKSDGQIKNDFFSSTAVFNIIPVLDLEAQRSRTTSRSHSAAVCAQKIVDMVTSGETQLLTDSQKHDLEILLHTVSVVLMNGQFNMTQFLDILLRAAPLPWELVMILHNHGTVRLETYLSRCLREESLGQLKSRLTDLVREEASTVCLAGLMSELISLGFSDKAREDGTKRIALSLLNHLLYDILNSVLDAQSASSSLPAAFNKLTCDLDSFKMAATHLLSVAISYRPNMKVSQAIRHQANWAFGKISSTLVGLLKQLLLPYTPKEVLTMLGQVVDQQEVNWQILLSLVSVLVVCMPESSAALLEFTDQLLQEGLEGCEMEPALTGLLLARQACFQGPHVFLSYADWFQRTFSEGSRSLASSRKSFTFFIKFLTDLMPYESPHHIKVQILRPPFVPTKCRQILADYVLLAKTRLADLSDPLETAASEGTSTADTAKIDADVINAVGSFESTGKIAMSVMEASIFKKPYYIGHFLPTLLKPRPLPDFPDSKMKLIAALNKAEKIPQSLYTSYVKACRKEAQQLLDGVFLDSDTEDMELSPLDQLLASLGHLRSTVMGKCSSSPVMAKYTVAECISQICEKIEAQLSVSPAEISDQTVVKLDVGSLAIQHKYLQMIDCLLNEIARTLQEVYSSPDPDLTWLPSLLKAVLQYSCVKKTLYKRMWDLCLNKVAEIANHHIDTLATILVELQLLVNQLGEVELLSNSEKCGETTSFTEQIVDRLPMTTGREMKSTLRFCTMYLRHTYSGHAEKVEEALVQSVVKKFSFLSARLYPDLRFPGGSDVPCHVSPDTSCDIVAAIYNSDIFKQLSSIYQLSLEDWVCFELATNPEDDVFDHYGKRLSYYDWAMYSNFLPQLQQSREPGFGYKQTASIILKTILQKYPSNHCQHMNRCGKCDMKSSQETSSCNIQHLTIIVQQLTGMFHVTDQCADQLPWLLNLFNDLVHQKDTSEQEKTGIVVKFFRLCRGLPSHLVFSDAPNHLRVEHLHHMDAIHNFINSVFVPCLSEGVYLPAHFTGFIVHGLLMATERCSFHQHLSLMCDRCPALVPSILVHEHAVAPFIAPLLVDTDFKYAALLNCYRARQISSSMDPWCMASVLFAETLSPISRDSSMLESFLKKDTLPEQVLGPLVQMCILQHTYSQITGELRMMKKLDQILVAMVTSHHGSAVMMHLLSPVINIMVKQCTCPYVLRMNELGTLRFLASSPEKMTTVGLLDIIGYSRLLEIFVSVAEAFDKNWDTDTGSTDTEVSLEELSTLVSFLQKLISSTPSNVLLQIDKELILRCGPGVTDAFQRKL